MNECHAHHLSLVPRVCTHMCPGNCLCVCICLLSGALRIIKQFVVLTPSWPTASTRLRTHADRNWPAQHTHTLSHIARHTLTHSHEHSLSHTHTHKCNHATIVCLLLGQDFHLPSFVCGWHSHSPSSFPPPSTCHTNMYLYLYLYLPRVYFLPLRVCVWVWMGTQVQALFVYMAYWVRTSASNCVELTWRLIGVQVRRWGGEQKQLK